MLNGGFETGDLTDWTVNLSSNNPWRVNDTASALSGRVPSEGSFFAQTGCSGDPCINGTESQQSWLYQDVATLAGQQYLLSFDFSATGDPMELEVLFDGAVVFDLTGLGSQSSYTSYSTNVTASGTTSRLAFLGRQDPRYSALDNIALISDAPEPSAGILGFGGVLALCRFRRR